MGRPVLAEPVNVGYERFVADSQRRLFRFAVVLCGDPALAEDLVADVLGRVYERWATVSAAGSPYGYARRMVTNAFVDWTRRRSRTSPYADVTALTDRRSEPAPDHASVHGERAALLAELARLPRQQRAALALHYYEGLTYDQIAEVLGCRVASVRGYVSRGLRTLRITLTTSSQED